MGETLGILLDEQVIEQPHWIAVESGYPPIHLQGIAAVGLSLLIHQQPKLVERGIALIALEHAEEIATLRLSKVLADKRWETRRLTTTMPACPRRGGRRAEH